MIRARLAWLALIPAFAFIGVGLAFVAVAEKIAGPHVGDVLRDMP
jgi:hypothetical protein